MAKQKADVREFVTEAFDYLNTLKECSINYSVNRYLLEYIANGYVKYGNAQGFIEHIDEWIRFLCKIFPELGFDHDTHQIRATIDLQDQLVIIDDDLREDLQPIIDIQTKYGLLIEYKSQSKGIKKTTPLSQFFEYVEDNYPVITDRFKGLGSANAKVSREVIMDPKTRRVVRVKMDDIDTMNRMGVLVGKSKDDINGRKELLMDFKFTKDMIDN